jgi:epoxyqueuosine reductase
LDLAEGGGLITTLDGHIQLVLPFTAARTNEPNFQPRELFAPSLERMAGISEAEFGEIFRDTPVSRARYRGFLRNVAVAMGNAGLTKFRAPLTKLAASEDPVVADHARWAIGRLPSEP